MVRDIVECHLGDQSEEFAKWAFGPGYSKCHLSKLPKRWNKRHGKKLKLEGKGEPIKDIPKMIELWKQTKVAIIK